MLNLHMNVRSIEILMSELMAKVLHMIGIWSVDKCWTETIYGYIYFEAHMRSNKLPILWRLTGVAHV